MYQKSPKLVKGIVTHGPQIVESGLPGDVICHVVGLRGRLPLNEHVELVGDHLPAEGGAWAQAQQEDQQHLPAGRPRSGAAVRVCDLPW